MRSFLLSSLFCTVLTLATMSWIDRINYAGLLQSRLNSLLGVIHMKTWIRFAIICVVGLVLLPACSYLFQPPSSRAQAIIDLMDNSDDWTVGYNGGFAYFKHGRTGIAVHDGWMDVRMVQPLNLGVRDRVYIYKHFDALQERMELKLINSAEGK